MKKILPDVYCVALFAAIAFVYFLSPVSKGYRLEQHDSGANDYWPTFSGRTSPTPMERPCPPRSPS